MRYYGFKEIVNSYTNEKRKRSSIWARLVSRPLSFVFTYLLINIGVSANIVSILSILDAFVACILISFGGNFGGIPMYIGIGMFVFWHVLDCVDGNIARVKKESSYAGAFLDALSGYVAPAFLFLSVGTAAFSTTHFLSIEYAFVLIILGAFSSIADILTRIIYQKFVVTEYRLGLIGKNGDIDKERSSGLKHFADLIMKHMGYSSLFMPLLLVASIIECLDILVIFYAVYYFVVLFATVVLFVSKANQLERRVEELGLKRESDVKEF